MSHRRERRFFEETFSSEGVAALLKLSIIYVFVAMFWAVFDQTGSSWVLQAGNMDRRFMGVDWLESQIQVVNPILVMIMIPLFQFVIYPLVNKVFRLTSIRKMSIGFFLAAASFALLTVAQQKIDQGQVPSIAWQLWAYVILTSAEILISITGLEFSYTQAPKSMKSVVMAVWLFSVSLGNMFTSAVNHAIQVPGISQVAEKSKSLQVGEETEIGPWKLRTEEEAIADSGTGKRATLAGFDGAFDTDDDIVMRFDAENQLSSVETSDNERLEAGFNLIRDAFLESADNPANGRLPSDDEGNALLAALNGGVQRQFSYKQMTVDLFRITSPGADATNQTQWDIVLTGNVSRAKKQNPDNANQPYTWLEKQIIAAEGEAGQAKVDRQRGDIPTTELSSSITVGGQDTLEGADYFRFWTWLLVGTAVLFVPVGYLYKEKSYIQNENDEVE